MPILYDFELSGNAHKVRNLLSLLGVDHERVPLDLGGGAQRAPEFLERNPFGQVPVLVDGDRTIRDSSAILVYLARKFGGDEWLAADAAGEARVQEWLATATGDVSRGIAFARLIELFGADGDLVAARERAHQDLARFESHLANRRYLAADHPTIADIANYSYIALAPDGGVTLDAYPHVRAWLARLEALPGFEAVTLQRAEAA